MKLARHLFRLLILTAASLLVSCIDGREEFWLNPDGSGKADISYTIPEVAAKFQGGAPGVSAMLGTFLAETPAIKSSSHTVTILDGRMTIHVSASFDSLADFKQIGESQGTKSLPSSASGLTGEVEVTRDGRTFEFSRKIDAAKALPGSLFLPAKEFRDHKLTYIVHLPLAAAGSNALRTTDGGKTLVWEFPLAEAIKRPVEARFSATVPVPGWLLASTGVGAILIALSAFFVVKKFRSPSPSSL